MRLALAFTITSLSFAACGGDDTTTMPDAGDNGFNTPMGTLKANREVPASTPGGDPTWEEIGPANFACLNTPSADVASTVSITLNLQVTDFQSDQAVPSGTVAVFPNQDTANPFAGDAAVIADSNANLQVTIPAGTKRYGYKMTSMNALPTFLLNQDLDSPSDPIQPTNTPPCMDGNTVVPCRTAIQSVSNATAATLPALIGQTRVMGTGVVAGALRDCDKHEVSGFISTISTTDMTATPMMGAETYYFDSSVGLPVHHRRAQASSEDGLFMIIQVPASNPTGYVQMWGFPTAADLAAGMSGLKLVAQLQVPVLPDTVITGSYEAIRSN